MSALFATGLSGVIGRALSRSAEVHKLAVRLDEDPASWQLPDLNGASVIHLAAAVPTVNKYTEAERQRINVDGTIALARAVRDAGAARFVFVSSSHAYGNHSIDITEDTPLRPTSSYGEQKCAAEAGLHELVNGEPTGLVIARVFSVLDWGTGAATLGGRIERMCMPGNTEVLGTGDDVRDFLTPAQVAELLHELAVADWTGTVNVCSGIGISIGDAAVRLAERHGSDLRERIAAGTSQTPRIVGDTTRLREALGHAAPVWSI